MKRKAQDDLMGIYEKILEMSVKQREILLSDTPMDQFPAARFQRYVVAKRELLHKCAAIQAEMDKACLDGLRAAINSMVSKLETMERENIALLKNRMTDLGGALKAVFNRGKLKNAYARTKGPVKPLFIDKKRV